ncbi:hypothetical protein LCGC14_1949500 [marine sediment metagenome]|uniref:Uncharacterized protein n=1 Tax=marine sediment metagenome TaxID=412755 RepID=A0A0F9G681_9ZZZZ
MELSISERLVLLSVLPGEGDVTTLKVVRDLRMTLSFSEEEHKEYQFVQEGTMLRWNDKVEQVKEIQIGEKAKDIIVLGLSKLNEQKKLKMEHLPLYEKFIETK